MGFVGESFAAAISLIFSLDREVFNAVATSIKVALWATLLASLAGVPAGIGIAVGTFPGRRLAIMLLNTLMALPTVVVGLVFYGIFSHQGPLGRFGLLFTPTAMIVGGTVLAIPIVANYTLSTIAGADSRILTTAMTLGAGPLQGLFRLVLEERFGIIAAVVAGFGRVIAEVGVAMMLGGNIQGYTRTMTTAIALETDKGEFALGLALGIILMTVALVVNLFLNILQQK